MDRENSLGNKIRQLRKVMGLTQEQLAEKAGIDDKHLSKIENGLHLPSYKTIKKLSEVLNHNLGDINAKTVEMRNINPIFLKSLSILNSAKSQEEKKYYLEALRHAQKGIKLGNSSGNK